MSPYPTVVMVTIAHQKASGILVNTASPEKKTKAENNSMATIRNKDMRSTSQTLAFIAYSSTRKPLKFLTNRKSRKTRTIWKQCTMSNTEAVYFSLGLTASTTYFEYITTREKISTMLKNDRTNVFLVGQKTSRRTNSIVKKHVVIKST